MSEKLIPTWKERLAHLDKPTDFAEAQAAKMEAAELRRYIRELESASQPEGWNINPDELGWSILSPSGDGMFLFDNDKMHLQTMESVATRELLRQLVSDLHYKRLASQHGGREADRRDAERWRMAVRYIGARYGETGEQRFWVSPILSCITVDLMKGSVAEHFTNAIDQQIAKFPERAAPSVGNGGAEDGNG